MTELTTKEKKALKIIVNHIDFKVFCIEQREKDLGRLNYSLCSDLKEKQELTRKKIEKFKKKLFKCNPDVSGFINELTCDQTTDFDYYETKEVITRNFVLEYYQKLVEELSEIKIKNIDNFDLEANLKNLGYEYKTMKDFIKSIADAHQYLIYKSLLAIPKNEKLEYDVTVKKINDAFFRLESFMNGTLLEYYHFDFDTAFTEIFYITKKAEHFTYENCKRIGQYWELTEQIRIDYDKSNYTNTEANNNKAFCHNCNVITSINWDRIEQFTEFTTQDEIDQQNKKKSISDIIKPVNNIPMNYNHGEQNIEPIFNSTFDYPLDTDYKRYEMVLRSFATNTDRLNPESYFKTEYKKRSDVFEEQRFLSLCLEYTTNLKASFVKIVGNSNKLPSDSSEVMKQIYKCVYIWEEKKRIENLFDPLSNSAISEPKLIINIEHFNNIINFLKPLIVDIKKESIKPKEKPKSKHQSFTYINNIKGQSNLTSLKDSLIRKKLIASDTDLKDFRKVFGGEAIEKPIVWTGNISELSYFIKQLHNVLRYVEDLKQQQWAVTINCFIQEDGELYNRKKLRTQKIPTTSKNIDKALKNLK
jgi:hypothetical protein